MESVNISWMFVTTISLSLVFWFLGVNIALMGVKPPDLHPREIAFQGMQQIGSKAYFTHVLYQVIIMRIFFLLSCLWMILIINNSITNILTYLSVVFEIRFLYKSGWYVLNLVYYTTWNAFFRDHSVDRQSLAYAMGTQYRKMNYAIGYAASFIAQMVEHIHPTEEELGYFWDGYYNWPEGLKWNESNKKMKLFLRDGTDEIIEGQTIEEGLMKKFNINLEGTKDITRLIHRWEYILPEGESPCSNT